MKEIVALVFARYNSSRLPGKVLFALGDSTVLGICVTKLAGMGLRTIVATSDQPTDDPIVKWCDRNRVEVHRGELENVAMRSFSCLAKFRSDAFFRINADSPFLQPELLGRAMEIFEAYPDVDLVSNVLERSFPYGISVELINTITFCDHVRYFQGPEYEHITSYFYKNREMFDIKSIKYDRDLSFQRFVVDTPEDWEHLKVLHSNHPNLFNYNLSQLIELNISK